LPDTDFADAFRHIADQAISVNANAFLLAGDLFDRPQVEPPHLRQAQEILGKLKAAHIPVIAVAGNHDKALLNSDAPTWGLEGEQDAVADLFFDLKEGVRANKSVDELAELVQVSPLTGKIRAPAMASADTGAGESGRTQPYAERSA